MESVAVDIIYHLAELYGHDYECGQRWPVLLQSEKDSILSFRLVCRSFRDASWIPFRDLLAERIFSLNEEDLDVLRQITRHPRLAGLVQTLTLGSQVFTQDGLRVLELGLADHPSHPQPASSLSSPHAWQRSLSSRTHLPYDEIVEFKKLYEAGMVRQERFWSTGAAAAALSTCVYSLSKQHLRAIRICPRPCQVIFEAKNKTEKRLLFSSRHRSSHFVPHGVVNQTRFYSWRNIDRILHVIAGLDGSKLQLHDLRTSRLNNVRWPMGSPIFKDASLFAGIRTLKLSIRENELADDASYADAASEQSAKALVRCLMSAPHLKSLDLEISALGDTVFNSFAIAHLSRQKVPYRLDHLVLEYNVQSEEVLADVIRPHAATLERLLLINSWISTGHWHGWVEAMVRAGLCAAYLEVWKPCQGLSHDLVMDDVDRQFRLGDMARIARTAKVVCCLPQERWDNCYPRGARR